MVYEGGGPLCSLATLSHCGPGQSSAGDRGWQDPVTPFRTMWVGFVSCKKTMCPVKRLYRPDLDTAAVSRTHKCRLVPGERIRGL